MSYDVMKLIENSNDTFKQMSVNPLHVDVYVVGDSHGCYKEMVEIVNQCQYASERRRKKAEIIFLGDVIDRGPYFLEVFEFINSKDNVSCLMGNHELNFYLESIQGKTCRSKARRLNHDKFNTLGKDTQEMILRTIGNMYNVVYVKMDKRVFDYYQDYPFFPYYSKHYILSHSPIRNIESVGPNLLATATAPQSSMRHNPVDMEALDDMFDNVVFCHGHQSWNFEPVKEQFKNQENFSNRVINLDSSCVYGKTLTAMCLNDHSIIEVAAYEEYTTPHTTPKPEGK